MDIRIHEANLENAEDCYAILSLLEEYATTPEGGGKKLSQYAHENLIDALKLRGDCLILLAYHQDQFVGLLTGFEGFSTFSCKSLLNIHDIIVSASYRGNQISQQLLAYAETIGKQREYCKLTLEVLEGNRVARNAYQKFGFEAYKLDPGMGKALFWEKKI